MIALHNPDCADDDVLGEVGAKQPEQLVVVEPIPDIGFCFENFTEVVQETLPVDHGLAERCVRFQDHMLSLVALTEVLSEGLVDIHVALRKMKGTFLATTLVTSAKI